MLKNIVAVFCIMTFVVCGLTGCGKKENNSDATINGQKAGASTVKDIEHSFKGNVPKGLPQGFPRAIPFYNNAEIIEAHPYGSDGYTVVYRVKEAYEKVVDFYISQIEGMDKSGIGEDEANFEGMDIGDVHINGLTISKSDDATQVFITLRDYGKAAHGDNKAEVEEGADNGPKSIRYAAVEDGTLKKGYPQDIVPVFPKAKVIESSVSPSGDSIHAEFVLPPKSYENAVNFYKQALGITSKSFVSDLMTSETFEGSIRGWKVRAWIAQLKVGGNDPAVSVTINKEK